MNDALLGGFSEAPVQSSHAFRAALTVLSQPGEIRELSGAVPPAPLSVAAGVLLLTLCDGTTPLHLGGTYDCAPVRDWITFHCGAPLVGPDAAVFALGDWAGLQPLGRFAIGLPDYPDRSATLIIEMPVLEAKGAALRGPGIADVAYLSLPELAAFQANRVLFPLGFDCFFTSGTRVAALPRSTHVEAV